MPVLLQLVLWSALIISLGVGVALAVASFPLITRRDADWQSSLATMGGYFLVIALAVCVLAGLSHPVAALWTWRIAGGLFFCLAAALSFIIFYKRRGEFGSREATDWLVAPAAALVLFFAVAGWLLPGLPSAHAGSVAATSPLANVTALQLWHNALYLLLAMLTFSFGSLFIRASAREGPPSFERHWGGLGSGSGGWEISTSFSYLLATFATGGLFLSLLFHGERLQQAAQKPAAAPAPAKTEARPER